MTFFGIRKHISFLRPLPTLFHLCEEPHHLSSRFFRHVKRNLLDETHHNPPSYNSSPLSPSSLFCQLWPFLHTSQLLIPPQLVLHALHLSSHLLMGIASPFNCSSTCETWFGVSGLCARSLLLLQHLTSSEPRASRALHLEVFSCSQLYRCCIVSSHWVTPRFFFAVNSHIFTDPPTSLRIHSALCLDLAHHSFHDSQSLLLLYFIFFRSSCLHTSVSMKTRFANHEQIRVQQPYCCSGSHRIPSGLLSRLPGFSRCFLAPCASCSFVGVAPNLKIP